MRYNTFTRSLLVSYKLESKNFNFIAHAINERVIFDHLQYTIFDSIGRDSICIDIYKERWKVTIKRHENELKSYILNILYKFIQTNNTTVLEIDGVDDSIIDEALVHSLLYKLIKNNNSFVIKKTIF